MARLIGSSLACRIVFGSLLLLTTNPLHHMYSSTACSQTCGLPHGRLPQGCGKGHVLARSTIEARRLAGRALHSILQFRPLQNL